MELLPSLSVGVFVVNQLGVLLAGFVAYRKKTTEYQRLFWITGFAGGFTTLSSFALILHEDSVLNGIVYAFASLAASLLILNRVRDRQER